MLCISYKRWKQAQLASTRFNINSTELWCDLVVVSLRTGKTIQNPKWNIDAVYVSVCLTVSFTISKQQAKWKQRQTKTMKQEESNEMNQSNEIEAPSSTIKWVRFIHSFERLKIGLNIRINSCQSSISFTQDYLMLKI